MANTEDTKPAKADKADKAAGAVSSLLKIRRTETQQLITELGVQVVGGRGEGHGQMVARLGAGPQHPGDQPGGHSDRRLSRRSGVDT